MNATKLVTVTMEGTLIRWDPIVVEIPARVFPILRMMQMGGFEDWELDRALFAAGLKDSVEIEEAVATIWNELIDANPLCVWKPVSTKTFHTKFEFEAPSGTMTTRYAHSVYIVA